MKAWFPVETAPDGVAVLTIAMEGLPLNVWNAGSSRGFAEALGEVLARPGLRGRLNFMSEPLIAAHFAASCPRIAARPAAHKDRRPPSARRDCLRPPPVLPPSPRSA